MSVTFTDLTHERVTRQIAGVYEQKVWRSRGGFYTKVSFDKLPQECQQEHADIAAAALSGTTYNGRELPQWVQVIAHPPKKGTINGQD